VSPNLLIVSNVPLKTDIPTITPSTFLKSSFKGFVININNDYRYMKTGYFVSLHAEILGDDVVPTTENAIDAYRPPILLTRAAKNGIQVMPFILTDSVKRIMAEFAFPIVIFPVNPFMFDFFRVAGNRAALYRAVKSLSMNYRYAVCAQPLLGELMSINSFFGECNCEYNKVKAVAKKVYETFNIPICKLHIQRFNGNAYLCGLQPVKLEEIQPGDVDLLSKIVSRFSGKDD